MMSTLYGGVDGEELAKAAASGRPWAAAWGALLRAASAAVEGIKKPKELRIIHTPKLPVTHSVTKHVFLTDRFQRTQAGLRIDILNGSSI
mmetsp:Transcript_34153/g.89876  ORF Transcript_34153/g.89876 Transcript_34153/m.89876 type:complete len:90 (+) Transcript_34153:1345-1614(+)